MNLNALSPLDMILLAIIIYSSYSAYKLKDKIWCTYRRADRTKIEQFSSKNQRRIVFDGGWYDIEPARTTLIMWTKGIHLIIPTWVRSLDFRHDSSRALNPDTFENTWDTPQTRANLDMTEDVRQLNEGNRRSEAKQKMSMLQTYLPYIVIIGFVVIGYFIYTNKSDIALMVQRQDSIASMIQQLLKK